MEDVIVREAYKVFNFFFAVVIVAVVVVDVIVIAIVHKVNIEL